MENTGKRIRSFLKEEGRSQTWLSARTGLSRYKLSCILEGSRDMTLTEYDCICTALGVPPGRFLGWETRRSAHAKH